MTSNWSQTEYYNSVCRDFANEIAKSTPQLFLVKDHSNRLPPAAFGSAILAKLDQAYFLITAAHCVDGINLEYLGIVIGNDFCTIGGQLFFYESNQDTFDPNNADMAVIMLDAVTVASMKEKYEFMDWQKIGLDHLAGQSSKYLIFGYPASKTRRHFPTKQIIPEPLVLRTVGASDEYYLQEQINKGKIFLLYVDQKSVGKATDSEIEELPKLGGISGCGVWTILDLFTPSPKYRLVGLITGEGRNKTVLYCSKINNAERVISTHFKIETS
jgi:hypothetical protein